MEHIPILRLGEFLLVTIQIDMHDRLALRLQDDLTNKIAETNARGVLIDISALEIVDSFIGRMISNISAMARILDAATVVVGMRPAVAITLVELGLSLPGVRTALDVEKGMSLLRASLQARAGRAAMVVLKHESLAIRSENDVVAVRQAVRKWAAELTFSLVDQTKIVTAASELARNTLIHGGGGTARLEIVSEGLRKGLRLTFEDQGPGIPDIELALKDGYTTGNGLGLGLSGSKRLMTEFKITSQVGHGTRVEVAKWKQV